MASSIPRPINIGLSILSVIGLVLWTAASFLGLFFYSGGSYGISIPLAVAVGGLMALFLFLTRRYTSFAAQGYRTREANRFRWIYLGLYIFVSLGSVFFVMHAVAVSTTIKNDYRTSALEDLRGLYNIVDKNAPDGSYAEYVNNQVNRYRQGNGHKDASTLNFECQQLRERLEKRSGYNNLSDVVKEYWSEADYTVRNWDLFYLPSTVNTYHDKEAAWVDSIQSCSNAGAAGIYATLHTPYISTYKPKSDLYYKFRSINSSDFSGWCIPVALLLQILILGSWIAMLKGGNERSTGVNTSEYGGGVVWDSKSTWTPE